MHICMPSHLHTCTHAHMHTCTHAQTLAYTYARTNANNHYIEQLKSLVAHCRAYSCVCVCVCVSMCPVSLASKESHFGDAGRAAAEIWRALF